ncbi:MAG: GxxExxY protein [Rhodopila sp.]
MPFRGFIFMRSLSGNLLDSAGTIRSAFPAPPLRALRFKNRLKPTPIHPLTHRYPITAHNSATKARSPEPGPVVTDRIIRLAINVHRRLGPGLLETVYHQCLCRELQHDGIAFETEVPLPIVYEDARIDKGFRADIIVDRTVLLELRSVERVLPSHEAQVLTYLRLSGCRIGLLMNFNCVLLKDGLHRFIP